VLAQNRNDLLLSKPDTLHRPSLQQGRTLILRGGKTQWQVTGTNINQITPNHFEPGYPQITRELAGILNFPCLFFHRHPPTRPMRFCY
jgi:hypothetical protein